VQTSHRGFAGLPGLTNGERELFATTRAATLRAIMLNHWYHHRGQLTVYLRELGVPIPSIYGPMDHDGQSEWAWVELNYRPHAYQAI
jgi:hypothetical protein